MKKNWCLEKENPKLRNKLADSLNISPVTAQILLNRGIKNEAEANVYLNSTLFDLPSPYLMDGMEEAVERIKKALESKEKIAIYGDYDVDGVTSTALFHTFLKSLGADVTYYNPDRIKEGYGVNMDAVKKLSKDGVTLIISGDCGITAAREVEEAKKLGVDFIVTDHHQPPEELPRAISILNPQLPSCKYPAKEIAGVGVIFNLAIALRRALRDEGFFKQAEPNLADYLDLVALGTVADCAPLKDVNRIFVKEGMKRMASPKRIGLKALKEASSIDGEVNSFDLGFKLGPRINASGRLNSAESAVKLFLSDNMADARELATQLSQENTSRQKIESQILKEAIQMIDSDHSFEDQSSVVVSSPNWHQGIIGIVASRIVERYGKPAILIAIGEDGVGKGSGRSVQGVNIYSSLSECRELLIQYGGHELAAGMSIKQSDIESFREMFNLSVEKSPVGQETVVSIDCAVDLSDISHELVSELGKLEPFGIGNPEPVLLAEGVEVVSQQLFKDKHLSVKVSKGGKPFKAIWFNMKEPGLLKQDRIDIVFTPEFNIWNGRKELQLRVRDID